MSCLQDLKNCLRLQGGYENDSKSILNPLVAPNVHNAWRQSFPDDFRLSCRNGWHYYPNPKTTSWFLNKSVVPDEIVNDEILSRCMCCKPDLNVASIAFVKGRANSKSHAGFASHVLTVRNDMTYQGNSIYELRVTREALLRKQRDVTQKFVQVKLPLCWACKAWATIL